jgi:preprotein translocase subunit SecE
MNTQSGLVPHPSSEILKWVVSIVLVALVVLGNSYYGDQPFLYRLIGVIIGGLLAALVALQTIKGRAFVSLLKDARSEVRRVVWPTRPETVQTTLIVLVCVAVAAFFLWLMDLGFGAAISSIIG